MLSFAAFIPIIGPIIQGVSSIFTGYFNEKVQLKQADVQQDIAETQSSVAIIQATEHDWGVRLARDLICFPVAVWCFLLSYDTIIAEVTWFDGHAWMWHVASFDKTGAPYLPYAVLTFLLGNLGINMWSRK